ncbi:MAG: cupredoxin domain-containing protein [Actinomycetota bacterium]|nr:cupredoxin domain-containing protein [Actinomycetota bacterium]
MTQRQHLTLFAVAAMTAGVLAGCAPDPYDGPGAKRDIVDDGLRVVEVEMTEMAFGPANINVAAGETVRLRFHNSGLAVHEAVIGDLAFQVEHDAEMAGGSAHQADSHEAGAAEPEALVVAAGDTTDMVYTAGDAGALIIGCHQPGHWDAGMQAGLTIS